MAGHGRGRWSVAGAALGAVLAVAIAASPAAASHSPLAGRWALDTTYVDNDTIFTPDASGHGNHAANIGAEAYPGGRFGAAMSFGNSGSQLRAYSANASFGVLEPQRVTVTGWVRSIGDPPDAYDYIVAKGANGCDFTSWSVDTGDNKGLRFYVALGGTFYTAPIASPGFWGDNKWHAFAGVFDGSAVRLYLDGNEVGSGTPVPPGSVVAYEFGERDLTMGNYPGNCVANFDYFGALDEVRVYDRALTLDEIRVLHDPNATTPPELPSPVGGSGGGGAGGSLPEPVARVTTGRSAKLQRATWLSAATSFVPQGVRLVRQEWDFNLDGVYEIACGEGATAVSRPFRTPGTKNVAVRVTDSLGRTATTRQSFTVARREINRARGAETVSTCENPGPDFQPDRADCVKTFAWGIVEVNGQGGADQCFQITARLREELFARASGLARTLQESRWFRASIRGRVAINGILVPVPGNQESIYDTGTSTISAGIRDVSIGPYRIGEVPLAKEIPYKLTKQGPKSKFQLGGFDLEKVTKPVFGLRAAPSVKVAFLNRATEVIVGLKLPSVFSFNPFKNDPAEGAVALIASNREPVKYDGAKLKIPYVFVGPLMLNDLFFDYRLRDNTWNGGAGLRIAPLPLPSLQAVPPPPDNGFGLKDGKFDHAGVRLDFPLPGTRPVLFPGVTLRSIGAAIGVKPTRFNGNGAIAVGEIVEVDGQLFAVFATPERPYYFPEDDLGPGLGPLAGRKLDSTSIAIGGTVGLKVKQLGFDVPLYEAFVFYAYPDFAEFGGSMGFDHEYFELRGGVKGFVLALQKKFNAEGSFTACLRKPIRVCAPSVGGVVSSKGIGFCTVIPVPNPLPLGPRTIPVPGGIGYTWGQGTPQVMIFSCDYGGYREQNPRAASAAGVQEGFTLPAGLPAAMVRVRGRGGTPAFTLVSPRGERTEVDPGSSGTLTPDVATIPQPEANRVLVALRRPAAGRWRIERRAGSVPLAGVAVARGLAPARVVARVTGRGARRTLTYRVVNGAGRLVTFAERGPRTYRELGRTRRARGRIRFTPGAGSGGRRRIVATIERGDVPARPIQVATYVAPRPRRAGRPAGIRVTRRRSGVVVRWRRVAGAARYTVTLTLRRGGARSIRVTRKPVARFGDVPAAASGRVRIGVIGANGLPGRSATAHVRAAARRR